MSNHYRRLERMYLAAPNNAYYRPILEVGDGSAEIRITVRPDFFHAAGAVHGSVYFKALDDASFFAVNSLVEEFFVLTVGLTTHLTRPVSEGEMIARGSVISRGRNLYVAEAHLTDDRGRTLGHATGSFMPSRMRLADTPGYAEPEGKP